MTIFKTYWKIVKKNIGIIILYTVMLLVFGTMNLKANKNRTRINLCPILIYPGCDSNA